MALAIRSKLLLTLIPVLGMTLAPLATKAEAPSADVSEAFYGHKDSRQGSNRGSNRGSQDLPDGQQAVGQAIENGQGLNYVEVTDVEVVRVLPDDTQGLQHQKWVVALANGTQVLVVYNIDICDRIPVEVGQKQSIGGQFIWDRGGGLLHWVHADPRHKRPDGYVEAGGVRYGEVTHPNR